MTKLCIDCVHHRRSVKLLGESHHCFVSGKVDIVDGRPIGISCRVMRGLDETFRDVELCGRDGKLFEPKPKVATKVAA